MFMSQPCLLASLADTEYLSCCQKAKPASQHWFPFPASKVWSVWRRRASGRHRQRRRICFCFILMNVVWCFLQYWETYLSAVAHSGSFVSVRLAFAVFAFSFPFCSLHYIYKSQHLFSLWCRRLPGQVTYNDLPQTVWKSKQENVFCQQCEIKNTLYEFNWAVYLI